MKNDSEMQRAITDGAQSVKKKIRERGVCVRSCIITDMMMGYRVDRAKCRLSQAHVGTWDLTAAVRV